MFIYIKDFYRNSIICVFIFVFPSQIVSNSKESISYKIKRKPSMGHMAS